MKKINAIMCVVLGLVITMCSMNDSIVKAAGNVESGYDYSNSSLYILGDSIIEGKGNDYVGVGDLLIDRGATVVSDVSEHGDLITNVPYSKDNYKRGNIYNQVSEIERATEKNGYDENTIVILDGGTNDLIKYYKEQQKQGLDRYFNITLFENDGSDHDMESAIRYTLENLISIYGNDDKSQEYKVPIVFIIPTRQDIIEGEESEYISYMEQSIGRIKAIVEEYSDYGVITVDMADNLDADSFADKVHPNAEGYEKILTTMSNRLTNEI